jgi:hypothetical protein
MFIKTLFTPDHARHEGVRPIQIHLLRLVYFLMAVFVATDSWTSILAHKGPWDPVRAVAFCAWASYSTLSVLGLIHPLRMLPLMLFMIGYKLLWLAVVAWPLWRTGTLAGSSAEAMTLVFLWIPLPMVAVPWGYVVRNFVLPPRRVRVS